MTAAAVTPPPGHPLHDGGVVTTEEAVTRVLLLTATAAVAGLGLLAPWSGTPSKARRTTVGLAAAAVILLALPAITRTDIDLGVLLAHLALVVVIPHAMAVLPGKTVRPWRAFGAALALTALLCWEATSGHTGAGQWMGVLHVAGATLLLATAAVVASAITAERRLLARRLAGVAIASGLVLAGSGVVRMYLAEIGLDAQLYTSGYGVVLTAKVALSIALFPLAGLVLWRRRHWLVSVRVGAVVVAGVLAAGTALAAFPELLPKPEPGLPLLRQVQLAGDQVPVLVTPHRPGRNLVHIGGGEPMSVAVGRSPDRLRSARPITGAAGGWVVLDLPAGPGTVWLRKGDDTRSFAVDPGNGPRATTAASGPDGPECASVALGRLLADLVRPLDDCPADRLSGTDSASLQGLARSLSARRVGSVTLIGDDSPRSLQAEQVARAALASAGIDTTRGTTADAVIVVSGWSVAATELARVGELQTQKPTFTNGVYLAPWLLTPPVLTSASGIVVPLRYNPHDQLPAMYAARIGTRFAGAVPSPAGYRAWLAAQPQGDASLDESVPQLYAASLAAFLPKEFAHHRSDHGWLPNGTVVPASGPLDLP